MSKYTITITREFGSLGRPIAHALSQKLGIEYYDRDIVDEVAKQLNLPGIPRSVMRKKAPTIISFPHVSPWLQTMIHTGYDL